MRGLVSDWLTSRKEQIILFEKDDEIVLKHEGGTLLMRVQLTSTRPDNATLQSWMELGAVSLNHFQGVLTQKADSGALWLIQNLRGGQGEEAYVLGSLETLLNQRDTWRAIFARLARHPKNLKPTSLRSLSY